MSRNPGAIHSFHKLLRNVYLAELVEEDVIVLMKMLAEDTAGN